MPPVLSICYGRVTKLLLELDNVLDILVLESRELDLGAFPALTSARFLRRASVRSSEPRCSALKGGLRCSVADILRYAFLNAIYLEQLSRCHAEYVVIIGIRPSRRLREKNVAQLLFDHTREEGYFFPLPLSLVGPPSGDCAASVSPSFASAGPPG